MTDAYDLHRLGPREFENLVNFLALKTLGLGHTGFGPGADGGRDGYFEGEAPYPGDRDRWSGAAVLDGQVIRDLAGTIDGTGKRDASVGGVDEMTYGFELVSTVM
jgi:hypothetical protein